MPTNEPSYGKVLIAEDDEVCRISTLFMIRCLGLSADVVNDGEAAVRKFSENRYDLILMDCQMPKMNGFDATARIREIESRSGRPRTPIVAMTGSPALLEEAAYQEAGMDYLLGKPMNAGTVREVCLRFCDKLRKGGLAERR